MFFFNIMFLFFIFILSVNAQKVIQPLNTQATTVAKCSSNDLQNEIVKNYWSVDVLNIKDWNENESHEIRCQQGYGDKKARTTTTATCNSSTLQIDNGPNCQPICEKSDLENNNWNGTNNWLRDWFEGESQEIDCLTSYVDIKDRTTTVTTCEKREGSSIAIHNGPLCKPMYKIEIGKNRTCEDNINPPYQSITTTTECRDAFYFLGLGQTVTNINTGLPWCYKGNNDELYFNDVAIEIANDAIMTVPCGTNNNVCVCKLKRCSLGEKITEYTTNEADFRDRKTITYCTDCAAGKYTDLPALTTCKDCLTGKKSTVGSSQCTDICTADNECQNGGSCVNNTNIRTCDCAAGYSGTNCQTDIDDCTPNPCKNGANCTDNPNGYTCGCVAGYSGTNCEITDECTPTGNECQNDGTCQTNGTSYECDCATGFSGTNCDTNIDDCVSNPCQNGANCTDIVNGYTCNCVVGWEGTTCDTNIDDCVGNSCQNGATCEDKVNGYTCNCASGWEGKDCDNNIDDCASNPCQNGGICKDDINYYECTCASGWSGIKCNVADICNQGDCLNDGNCIKSTNGQWVCNCITGYNGNLCENKIDIVIETPVDNKDSNIGPMVTTYSSDNSSSDNSSSTGWIMFISTISLVGIVIIIYSCCIICVCETRKDERHGTKKTKELDGMEYVHIFDLEF